MLIPYKCCLKDFEDYYLNQEGNGLLYYKGQSFQKGYGIGGWFKKIFRTVLPLISKGTKTIGKEVLRTGTQIAGDVLEGKDIRESAEVRTKEAGRKLAKKAMKKADDMLGQGKRYKRKRKLTRQATSLKPSKVKRRDIFDP